MGDHQVPGHLLRAPPSAQGHRLLSSRALCTPDPRPQSPPSSSAHHPRRRYPRRRIRRLLRPGPSRLRPGERLQSDAVPPPDPRRRALYPPLRPAPGQRPHAHGPLPARQVRLPRVPPPLPPVRALGARELPLLQLGRAPLLPVLRPPGPPGAAPLQPGDHRPGHLRPAHRPVLPRRDRLAPAGHPRRRRPRPRRRLLGRHVQPHRQRARAAPRRDRRLLLDRARRAVPGPRGAGRPAGPGAVPVRHAAGVRDPALGGRAGRGRGAGPRRDQGRDQRGRGHQEHGPEGRGAARAEQRLLGARGPADARDDGGARGRRRGERRADEPHRHSEYREGCGKLRQGRAGPAEGRRRAGGEGGGGGLV